MDTPRKNYKRPSIYFRYAPPTAMEWVRAIVIIGISLPFAWAACILRRIVRHNEGVPFVRDLMLASVRSAVQIPLAIVRRATAPKKLDFILNSKRFSHVKQGILDHVSFPNFEGYWVYQRSKAPKDSDIVLFFVHGGAYLIGHPAGSFAQDMCLAEMMVENGMSLSFFSLQYSLSPEAKFPVQLDEATAAYQYLIEELEVSPNKIILMGESAGGHLLLLLLNELNRQNIPRPHGAMLLYPWVDLTNSAPSMTRNQHRDILVKSNLDQAVADVFPNKDGNKRCSDFMDFSKSQELKKLLPVKTYVNVGTHDMLHDSVAAFVEQARQQGAQVEFDVIPNVPHGWTAFADAMDVNKYLSLTPGESIGDLMKFSRSYTKFLATVTE